MVMLPLAPHLASILGPRTRRSTMILIPRRELDTDGGEYQGAEPVDDVKEVVHGQGALF
jgi:hypothetical protein